jgi:hypothetical protein
VPVSDPVAALVALAAEALRWKDYFAERIATLETLRFQAGAGEQIPDGSAPGERSSVRHPCR